MCVRLGSVCVRDRCLRRGARVYASLCVPLCECLCVCLCEHVRACVFVYARVCVCVSVCVCVFMDYEKTIS